MSEKPRGVAVATLSGFSRNLTKLQPKGRNCSRRRFLEVPNMNTLPKTARLKGQKGFERLLREGVRKRAGQIILVAGKSGKQRIGVRISRRVGSAVERNRIRRVVREFFRLNREAFPAGGILVIALPGLAEKTNSEIRGLVKRAAGEILKCQTG